MIQLYQIANHTVDIARNQITRDLNSESEFSQTLPPKTIMVLTELAKSQGQVISHDQLMNSVWGNTVVSSNSIQRCIAQLRKALLDDRTQQRIIKTHAKKGYSLELGVKFIQEEITPLVNNVDHQQFIPIIAESVTDEVSPQDNPDKSPFKKLLTLIQQKMSTPRNIFSIIGVAILSFLFYEFYLPKSREFSFDVLSPITSSDNLERNASYSPDGKYILFHRYDGLCDNNIWAKELATGKESRLTKTYGFYSDHNFTENGNKLAFMAKVSCGPNKKQKKCWNLMTLDFGKALREPQQPELTVSCDQGLLSNPIWLENGNIVALNRQDTKWNIVKFMPGSPGLVSLYTSNEKSYYYLNYSKDSKELIALATNSSNEQVIDVISPKGELISSHIIDHSNIISPYELITPIIDPQVDQLLFSTGKRLFSLSFTGEIAHVSTLNYNYLSNIKMNETGDNIVAVQGVIDTDIAKINIDNIDLNVETKLDKVSTVNFNQLRQPYPSIARSIAEDYDAKFQPKGELIAFISTRSGTSQIWMKHKEQLSQLTNFPIDTKISSFSWSPSGSSIILVANAELVNVYLDKEIKKIPLGFGVLNIYQWRENNEVLLKVRRAGQPQLIKYNLATNELTTLLTEEVKWAINTESDQLMYLDLNNLFWISKENKTESINKLEEQFGSKRFVFENGNIFGINSNKKLWRYKPKTGDFKVLHEMDTYTHFVSDIKEPELLLTQIIAAKQEVVVLTE